MIVAKVQRDLLLLLNRISIIYIIFSVFNVNAATLIPKQSESKLHKDMVEMLTNVFYEELYKRTYHLKPAKNSPKSADSVNKGKRGKLIIEQMKQRNREKLAIMRGVDPTKVKQGSDIVKLQQEDTKEMAKKITELSKSDEWQKMAQSDIQTLKQKVMIDHKAWRKKHLPTLKEWEEKREKYLGHVDDYKNNLADIPLILPVSKDEQEKKVDIEIKKEYAFVSNALAVYIRDQSVRPTCAAFAGMRAAEILLAQHNEWYDLSEQYFYWASKPNCRNNTCTEKGSWEGYGLQYSQKSSKLDIPLEKDCPYEKFSQKNNETQIPLKNSCDNGKIKIKDFTYSKTLDEIITQIDQNKPVTAGIKLTPNFYDNRGIIFESEKDKGGKLDFHAQGHTLLIVGYLKLPQIFDEGKVCFVVANSWGAGWGHGGYSCISEKWLLNHRNRNPFISLNSIEK